MKRVIGMAILVVVLVTMHRLHKQRQATGKAELVTGAEIAKVGEIDELWKELDSHINLVCEKDQDCQQVAVGKNHCGGPKVYVLYSTRSTKMNYFRALINQINHTEKLIHENSKDLYEYECVEAVPYLSFSCQNNVCQD